MISFCIGMFLAMLTGAAGDGNSSLTTISLLAVSSIVFMIRGVYVMNRNGDILQIAESLKEKGGYDPPFLFSKSLIYNKKIDALDSYNFIWQH